MHGFDVSNTGMGTTAAACLAIWLLMVGFAARHYLRRWARRIESRSVAVD